MVKSKFVKPFALGDVVRYRTPIASGFGVDEYGVCVDLFPGWTVGEEHIIREISVRGKNRYEYATNQGAWIPHESFEFVRAADEASMEQLMRDMDDEEESFL